MPPQTERTSIYALLGLFGLYIVVRFAGAALFDNNWSFLHWQYTPAWYLIVWAVAGTILIWLALSGRLTALLSLRRMPALIATVSVVAAVVFRFDSFVYGGGNLRVAQLAQVDVHFHRWYEFGTSLLTTGFYHFWSLFDIKANTAGTLSWQSLAFLATAASAVAACLIARRLTNHPARQSLVYLTIFFGPSALLMFGFVGLEPVVVAFTLWAAYWILKTIDADLPRNRLILWAVVVTGMVMHFTLAYLVPAAVAATILSRGQTRKRGPAIGIGLATLTALIVAVYWHASGHFGFQRELLFFDGKNPQSDYGVVSGRHLGDLLQFIWLIVPAAILLDLWSLRHWRQVSRFADCVVLSLMGLSGTAVIFILDPKHGMAFDIPRFVAYMAPIGVITAMIVLRQVRSNDNISRLPGLMAVVSLLIFTSYYPVYGRIHLADSYLQRYIEKHDDLVMPGCFAFRDAYFQRGELRRADRWEWEVPKKSLAYVNFEGCKNLLSTGRDGEAIKVLNQIKLEYPYWSEPRALLATTQMRYRRWNRARPEIDTCLMLEPYRKEYLINDYRCLRDTRQMSEAIEAAERVLQCFEGDVQIESDLMFMYYFHGNQQAADSLAEDMLERDPNTPYPYSLKGMIEEKRGNTTGARYNYEKFLELAPDDPDAPAVRERLSRLPQ